MTTNPPSLAELIDALPAGADAAPEATPARDELEEMLAQLGRRPVPTGRLPRMWSLGTLQAKIAAGYLAWWLRKGFRGAEANRQGLDETHVAAAIQVLGRMTYLRGAVMKMGQIMAHWPDVLPNAFAETLGRLHCEAPPMHFELLREHVHRELGGDPTELFDDFETEAFAAASLGQVHRARLKGTDRKVAIKIQYPGIARTIHADIANLKTAAFGMRLHGDWDNLLDQYEGIQRMLEQEADYEAEARCQAQAQRILADLDEVVVPRVLPEFSTGRILTTELLEGEHLEPFLARKPGQATRDRHGAQICRATSRLWYAGRMVYADPHPGNFLFLPDGRLGLLDFGCCHHFSDEEFEYVMEVERSALSGDDAHLMTAMSHGCLLDPSEVGQERLDLMRAYCDWCWEPLRAEGAYDFSDREHFQKGARIYGEFMRRGWVRSQPVNVWLTKVFYGVRAMLTHLEARVEYGGILREESPL